ncbi:hypothetical protein [Flexithrix dorotheae]|uniref:hypothetical protein n=1 Tax=Flexithrix dorotheae TaxID=70993 RepID=UPI00038126F1|nr:hypothetical protein [Flexithrix dorotheae]
MANQIADLHCHPSGWAFNRMRNTSLELDKEKFHPWTIEQSSLKKQLKGGRAYRYSQCDFGKLVLSGTRLVFGALYPLEKGFFDEQLIGEGQRKSKRHSLLDIIQSKTQGLSKARIAFLQSPEYDYFEELKLEYKFYKSRDNKEEAALVLIYDKNKPTLSKGKYILAKNNEDITASIQKEKEVAIVLTIEGIHALGVGNLKNKGTDVSIEQVKERVRALKGEASTEENWEHPVFFITFSHHFDNTLCGHAHSFPDVTELIFNQRKGCNGPMTPEGLEVIREMLGLNENLEGTGSKRILVDVKHMSALGRQSFYNDVIKKYNNFAPNRAHKIPVIASHVGFSGANTLDELVRDGDLERDNFKKEGFYAWNINICREDVEVIHESEGLIGLSFDARILGVDNTLFNVINFRKRNNIKAFSRTIKKIVEVPFRKRLDNPLGIWKRISIGTDFEGYIDPVNKYSTAIAFGNFGLDLEVELKKFRRKKPEYFGNLDIRKDIIEGILFNNAYEFVKKHFNKTSPKPVSQGDIVA